MRPSWGEFRESLDIAGFGDLGRPWRKIVPLDNWADFRGRPEVSPRLGIREAGEPRRLEVSSGAIACLDERHELIWQHRRQPEAEMDGSMQPRLHHLVSIADDGVEG